MPGVVPRGAGAAGATGIGTSRWAPAWGTESPLIGLSVGACTAAGAGETDPSAGATALVPAAADAEPAWPPLCGNSVTGLNDGAGVSEGGVVGWSSGVCCWGTGKAPLWGTICG